jgi:hypothetical protein
VSLLILTNLPVEIVRAASLSLPEGFELIDEAPGIQMFKKEYRGGTPDYVQIIDLMRGAGVVPILGQVQDTGAGNGVYGGNDARISQYQVNRFWNDFSATYQGAFCMVNGEFFLMRESPTRLPFPLKVNGEIITDGYAIQEYQDQKLILEIWADRVDIQPLTRDTLYQSDANHIIAGLTEDARKNIQNFVGRTFIGVLDQEQDGRFETLLVFSTKTAKQKDAAEVLRSFGAEKVMMLDGGESTQLVCRSGSYISTDRHLPQVIGITSALSSTAGAESFPESPEKLAAGYTSSIQESLNRSAYQAQPVAEALSVSVANLQQTYTSLAPLDLDSVVWVPMIMLPFIVLVGIAIFAYFRRDNARF